jgi:16S rRNA U1498 N3-methylase RsmE
MTNEELAQLAELLTPEQKEKSIAIVCGPEEDWSEAEFP